MSETTKRRDRFNWGGRIRRYFVAQLTAAFVVVTLLGFVSGCLPAPNAAQTGPVEVLGAE